MRQILTTLKYRRYFVFKAEMDICEHNYFKRDNLTLKKNVFQCRICAVIFKHYGSLYKHLKRVHKVTKIGGNNIKCLEEQCNEGFNKLAKLEAHLGKNHLKKIEKQKLSFESLDEFKIWKREMEKETESEYITYSPGSSSTTLYFKCSRSGVYKERLQHGNRRRRLKAQGSKKSGAHCISRMVVQINDSSGAISVNFCKTHYGHNLKVAHVGLSRIEEDKIAATLVQGVSASAISDRVRNSITDNKTEQIDGYTCMCPDLLIKGSMCKYVHAVALNEKANTVMIPAEPCRPLFEGNNETNILALDVTKNDDLEREKEQILSLLQSVTLKVGNVENIKTLDAVKKYLKCAESLLNLDPGCLPKETRQCQVLRKTPKEEDGNTEKKPLSQHKKRKPDPANFVNKGKEPCYFEEQELMESLLEN